MDRFIGNLNLEFSEIFCYLKSNMDRFIGNLNLEFSEIFCYLKSNMDRFIVIQILSNQCFV